MAGDCLLQKLGVIKRLVAIRSPGMCNELLETLRDRVDDKVRKTQRPERSPRAVAPKRGLVAHPNQTENYGRASDRSCTGRPARRLITITGAREGATANGRILIQRPKLLKTAAITRYKAFRQNGVELIINEFLIPDSLTKRAGGDHPRFGQKAIVLMGG